MKVLFVYPGIASIGFNSFEKSKVSGDISGTAIPLGIGYLASAVEAAGFESDIMDLRYLKGYDDVEEIIAGSNARVIALSVQTPSFDYASEVARIAKKHDKITVAGGVHATVAPQDFIKTGNYDYVITGEGEISMVDLLQAIDKGETKERIIRGVVVKDMDAFPRAKDFPMYAHMYRLVHNIEFGRGCPGRCTYCISWDEVMYGRRIKQRSIDKIIEGIEYYKQKYDFYNIAIEDVNATSRKKKFIEFCERLTSRYPNLRLTISTRVDCFDDDIARAMSLFNEAIVWFGFETVSPHLLKFLKKRVELEQNYKAAEICNKHKIDIGANVLVGIPTQTDEDIQKMYNFIKGIRPTLLYYNVLSPFPGTEIARYCKENNLIGPDIPYERYEVGQILRNGLIKGIDYNRVREWLPKFASCTRNADPLSIGIMFEQGKNYEEALEHYRKAEKSLRSIYHIASLLKRTGRHTEALSFFEEMDGFRCDGSNSYYYAQRHFHRGEIYYERGEFDKAREDFRKCLELLPEHKKAKEYITKIPPLPPSGTNLYPQVW